MCAYTAAIPFSYLFAKAIIRIISNFCKVPRHLIISALPDGRVVELEPMFKFYSDFSDSCSCKRCFTIAESKHRNESIFYIFTKQVLNALENKLLCGTESCFCAFNNQENIVNCIEPLQSFLNHCV
jgi:hypothetical protein